MLLIQKWICFQILFKAFALKAVGYHGNLQRLLYSDLPSRGQCCTLWLGPGLGQMGRVTSKVDQVMEGPE